MSLFQTSVVKKHLNDLSSELIDKKYNEFQTYFGNTERQENIRNLKEEEYQEGFIRELFVKILGYTLNPEPNYNLVLEKKNVDDSKKADGAILKESEVIAVIELKSTQTTDLDTVETQAFGYKNHNPKCQYIITSNFEKIRLYIKNTIDKEEFDLFNLTKERFSLLWLCLSKDNILTDIPLKIKEASVLQEENVTKKLYNDYSKFRTEIFENIVKNNPEYDKLLLFKKTQKLLDRFLFILFAEDRLLVPPNSITLIIDKWKADIDFGEVKSLFSIFKQYFYFLHAGRPKRGEQQEIFAYNGGLFLPDEILDTIYIDDDILYEHTLKLTKYDFETDVDVNILGHIFEHSLTEIENVQAEIAGEQIDKQKTKRKKDGIFYTPKYITKYIVENTVGKLCEEKRAELGIIDEDYAKGRKNRKKDIVRALDEKLTQYREWLLELTILDPACGSGAFLNQALEFLIQEHNKIDELKAQLLGGSIVFPDIEAKILEKNIFGIDLNEESVEIAKLSLWLRTAQKGRKLTTLSNHIKCGNSLIDDPEIAGEKAFNWQNEFPEIFKEKNKKAWHVTWATHDTRTSQRMIDYKVRERKANGQMHVNRPMYLEGKDAIKITEIISGIVIEENINCMAYNACNDHIHMLLVSDKDEITNQVRKLKGKSAQKFKEYLQIPSDETFHLWAQKYNKKPITTDEQLNATINYIQTNREKHQLPDINKGLQNLTDINKGLQPLANKSAKPLANESTNTSGIQPLANESANTSENMYSNGLKPLVDKMCCTAGQAFRTEYNGGFDVVIGNPPYVRQELFKEIKPYLEKHYKCYNSVADLYTYFIEKGINLMSSKGLFSFILPNKFLKATYGMQIRKVIKEAANLELIFDFDDYPVFEDATTYPIIYVLSKTNNKDYFYFSEINNRANTVDPINLLESKKHKVSNSSLTDEMWSFIDISTSKLIDKIKKDSITLNDYVDKKIFRGLTTGKNEAFIIDSEKRNDLISSDSKNADIIKILATGKEVKRNTFNFDDKYLLFTGYDLDIPSLYPDIIKVLDNYKEDLLKRYDKGQNYWNLRACAYYEEMQMAKIIYPRINNKGNFYLDEKGEVFLLDNNFFISSDSKSLLALLNSKLIFFYLKNICTTLQGGFYDFRRDKITTIPISKNLDKIELDLSEKSDALIEKMNEVNQHLNKFSQYLSNQIQSENLSKKLEDWFSLEFSDFIKEFNKVVKKSGRDKLTKNDEIEWMDVFETRKKNVHSLHIELNTIEKEIDQMVYELYGLTKEEIKIVEENINI